VWVTPFQWSFPLNLPPAFFGIFPAGELVDGDTDTPWGDEIEQKLLLPPPIGELFGFFLVFLPLQVTDKRLV
jgi:hypothetical protein